jgi:hypothetical protein
MEQGAAQRRMTCGLQEAATRAGQWVQGHEKRTNKGRSAGCVDFAQKGSWLDRLWR